MLRGKPPGEQVIQAAYSQLLQVVRFRTSRHRATRAYREDMACVLLEETLLTAWNRAGTQN